MSGFEKYTRDEIAAKLTEVASENMIPICDLKITIYDPGAIGVDYYDTHLDKKSYFEFNAFAQFSYFGGDYTKDMEGWLYSPLATMAFDAVKPLGVN